MRAKRLLTGVFRWVGQILLVGLCLFLGLISYLWVKESVTWNKYRAEYLPPGQLVNLGTHNIHLYCVGSGSPTVVFESDLDQYGILSWNSVQGEIGKYTRACRAMARSRAL